MVAAQRMVYIIGKLNLHVIKQPLLLPLTRKSNSTNVQQRKKPGTKQDEGNNIASAWVISMHF